MTANISRHGALLKNVPVKLGLGSKILLSPTASENNFSSFGWEKKTPRWPAMSESRP
jgi:hypothetical protein